MRRAATFAVSLLLLAGCGGGEEDDAPSPPAAASPAATSEPSEASSQPTTVDIEDFDFKPKDITVSAGDEVTWVNADASNHNVVFDDDAQEGIPNLREDQEDSVTFKSAGSFAYVCSYHPGMEGTVVVE